MRVMENGIYRDATPEEVAEIEAREPQPNEELTTITLTVEQMEFLQKILGGQI